MISNICNINFQATALYLDNLNEIKYIGNEFWIMFEINFAEKVSSLYKAVTVESVSRSYDKQPNNDRVIWNILEVFFKNNRIMKDLTLSYSACLYLKRKFDKELYNSILVNLRSFTIKQLYLEKYIEIISVMKDFDSNILTNTVINNINTVYLELLSSNSPFAYEITNMLIKANMIEMINFSKMDDEMFKCFDSINHNIDKCLEVYHKLIKYDKRFMGLYERLIDISNVNENVYLNILSYLRYFKSEAENVIYQRVMKDFLKIYEVSVEKLKYILSFPIACQVLSKNDIVNYTKRIEKVLNQYEGECREIEIIKCFLTQHKGKTYDIEAFIEIRRIKDLMNLSINEMQTLYDCNFYSSLYEDLYC
jgi:hypothetical protein